MIIYQLIVKIAQTNVKHVLEQILIAHLAKEIEELELDPYHSLIVLAKMVKITNYKKRKI